MRLPRYLGVRGEAVVLTAHPQCLVGRRIVPSFNTRSPSTCCCVPGWAPRNTEVNEGPYPAGVWPGIG